jgi:amino-acid N-acetyltransferase
MDYTARAARTADVRAIRCLVDANVASGRLLDKATVTLYEDIQEFIVAERAGHDAGYAASPAEAVTAVPVGPAAVEPGGVVGCGALHVMWEDLGEIRTIAVDESCQGEGVGHLVVESLLGRARGLGVSRVFVLTFAVKFFASLGFEEISGDAAAPDVYAELLRSYDEGVAEFLDLDRVKPSTLGNTRMLLRL